MLISYNNWAQIGWFEKPNGVRGSFVQVGIDGAVSYNNFALSSDPINDITDYAVHFDPNHTNGEYFTFWMDGVGKTGYDSPFPTGDPYEAAVETEIHTAASQAVGGVDNNNYVSSASIYYPAGTTGSWYSYSGTINSANQGPSGGGNSPPPSWFKISPAPGSLDAQTYDTWDTACDY